VEIITVLCSKLRFYQNRENVCLLCWGRVFLPCAITVLVVTFPSHSAVWVSEVYPDVLGVVIRATANIQIWISVVLRWLSSGLLFLVVWKKFPRLNSATNQNTAIFIRATMTTWNLIHCCTRLHFCKTWMCLYWSICWFHMNLMENITSLG
jgi:hypothetical protein